MTIVDIYDAVTTPRCYQEASSTEKALEIMGREVQQGWLDPHLFSEFRNLITTRGGISATGGSNLQEADAQ